MWPMELHWQLNGLRSALRHSNGTARYTLSPSRTRYGHLHVTEQLQSSALLKQKECLELFNPGSSDFHLWIYVHGSEDVVPKLSHIKSTTLRGAVVFRQTHSSSAYMNNETRDSTGSQQYWTVARIIGTGIHSLLCSRLIYDITEDVQQNIREPVPTSLCSCLQIQACGHLLTNLSCIKNMSMFHSREHGLCYLTCQTSSCEHDYGLQILVASPARR
jgi:hypothetical protein